MPGHCGIQNDLCWLPTPMLCRLHSATAKSRPILRTNVAIGGILHSSPRTVGKHLERIFEKLGVDTRTAAAVAPRLAAKGHFLPYV